MRIIQLPEAQSIQAGDVFAININGADYQVPVSLLVTAMKAIGNYLTAGDVANNLTTTAAGKVLDARQGKILDEKKADANDVLTISQQQLTSVQKAQVQENLGLEIATLAEVISYLGLS